MIIKLVYEFLDVDVKHVRGRGASSRVDAGAQKFSLDHISQRRIQVSHERVVCVRGRGVHAVDRNRIHFARLARHYLCTR